MPTAASTEADGGDGHGACIAGGLMPAWVCDFVVAGDSLAGLDARALRR